MESGDELGGYGWQQLDRQTDDDDAARDVVQCMWRDGEDGRDTCDLVGDKALTIEVHDG
jgi:hypothetical protein